jgi:hypothetical protein
MDPLSITTIVVSGLSLIGTITLAIIEIFKQGFSCENIQSSCCMVTVVDKE